MVKQILAVGACVILIGLVSAGCDEWMVGAPCVPETDDGTFNDGIKDITYSVETRSVQCETGICITSTRRGKEPDPECVVKGHVCLTKKWCNNNGTPTKTSYDCKDDLVCCDADNKCVRQEGFTCQTEKWCEEHDSTFEQTNECDGADQVCCDNRTNFEKHKDTQLKYSFCSCRCRDAEGNQYDKNSDKYDDLCDCPSSTTCPSGADTTVGGNIEGAPDKIKGSYCIPNCVLEGCTVTGEVCTPSTDSEQPWKWRCRHN
jgi:hypothetical protein